MIVQTKNTRFYANFNKNKNSYNSGIRTSSTNYTDGMIGGGLVLDNVDAYIEGYNLIDDLVTAKSLTIFFRFILTSFSTNGVPPNDTGPVIISYNGYGVLGSFYIRVLSNGDIYLVIGTSSATKSYKIPVTISLNTEYSIALTYNKDNGGTIRIYVDGVLTNTESNNILTQSSIGLHFSYKGELFSSGYKLGDVFVGSNMREYNIKRLHLGLHPF